MGRSGKTSQDMHWTVLLMDGFRPVRTLRIPRILLPAAVLLCILAVMASAALWGSYHHLRREAAQVRSLERIVSQQRDIISGFSDRLAAAERSLEEARELDYQLRAALGLDLPASEPTALVERINVGECSTVQQLAAGPENAHGLGNDEPGAPADLEPRLWALTASVHDHAVRILDLRAQIADRLLEDEVGPHRWPVSGGYVSSTYGWRVSPVTRRWEFHRGIDIAAPQGTPIVATGPGVVIFAGRMGHYGETVIIRHGADLETLYGHCYGIDVSVGQRVVSGQIIATVGSTGRSTGPHVHYEVRLTGEPVNPWPYLP